MRGTDPGRGGFGVASCHYIQNVAVLHDIPEGRDGKAINLGQAEVQPDLFVELEAGVEQGRPAREVVDAPVFEEERDAAAQNFGADGCCICVGKGREGRLVRERTSKG
jgi:hypothetical protein